MYPLEKLLVYRVVWLSGAVAALLSVFMTYSYQQTLMDLVRGYIPQMFNVFNAPTAENLTFASSALAFLLLVFSCSLCAVYAGFAHKNSWLWTAPRGIRVWNAADIGILAMIMFSSPVFIFEGNQLVQVTSSIGTQYSPTFQGLGVGYFVAWAGIIVALVAGSLTMRKAKVASVGKGMAPKNEEVPLLPQSPVINS